MAEGPSTLSKMSVISSSPDDPMVRILLMGRKGSGKSSSGNTILGKRKFKVKNHESELCEDKTQIGEKQVAVIDCPDLLDPELNDEQLEKLKEQLISRCSAGLSAVLLTVPLDKPVGNEEEILDFMKCLFGPEVQKHIMILFTHGDELEEQDQTIEEHLKNQDHKDLQQLVTEFGGKFHCFNNKIKSGGQIQELLQMIEGSVMEKRGKFIMEQIKKREKEETIVIPDEIIVIPERTDQFRLVLLGKTGAGKSATGNTIIGRKVFNSSPSSKSQTKQCQSATRERFGKEISVIDTPGLYDTKLSEDEIKAELVKCITLSSPGPHAFIIVIKVGRFTEEEKNTIKKLKEVFGEHMQKYSMIIFTHKNQLKKSIEEELLQASDPELKELVDSCRNRFFCLDNDFPSFPQFKDLLSKLEMMVAENGGHFKNDMFNETEKHIQEIQKQKLGDKVQQIKQEHKQVTQSEWQKIFWRLVESSRQEAKKSCSDTFIEDLLMYRNVNVSDIRKSLKNEVSLEEKERTIKEAERIGISRGKAVGLAMKATRTLAKQKMCKVQ